MTAQKPLVTEAGTTQQLQAADQLEVNAGSAALPSLTITSDPNTGIYSPGADQLAISTAGAQRAVVNASGRVGIGTATPAHFVDVQAGTLAGGGYALNVDATLTNVGGTVVSYIEGSVSAIVPVGTPIYGVVGYLSGAGVPSTSYAGNFSTTLAGNGADPVSALRANFALLGSAAGTTALGHNVGVIGLASNSSARNYGLFGNTTGDSAGSNVAVTGMAKNASGVRIGGLFASQTTGASQPTVNTSAALIADNMDLGDPIFLARDAGTTTFSIGNNGVVLAKNTTDSTTAFQVQNAAGTAILDVDTTNQRVGVRTATPGAALDVSGADALINGLTVGRGNTSAAATSTAVGVSALAAGTGTDNVAVGYNSAPGITTGSRTTGVGSGAIGGSLSTQSDNTAVGYNAQNKSGGSQNTSVGVSTLDSNSGSSCVAVGYEALKTNNGNNNVAVGWRALTANGAGLANVAVGYSALDSNNSGGSNVGVGTGALAANTTGSYSVAVGAAALSSATTGEGNVGVGLYAGANITTGGVTTQNVALGVYALGADFASPGLTGDGNVAVGRSALGLLTGAVSNNTAVGTQAMDAATSAQNCVAIGYNALGATTTAAANTAVGTNALAANTVNTQNTAVGYNALAVADADFNTAIGYGAGDSVTTGSNNTLVGNSAGSSTTTSAGLTVVGSTAGNAITAGTANLNSTAVGYNAEVGTTSTGQNTVVGASAGTTITSGTNLTCLGYNAEPSGGAAADEITLGANVVGTILRCVATTITAISDQRDKADIQDLSLGLDFLKTIHPVQFKWDRRDWYDEGVSDGSKKQDKFEPGFIAQELDAAQIAANAEWMSLAYKSNPDRLEATPMRLFPVVVKACQELAAKAAAAEARADAAEARLAALEAAVAALQAK
jgi:hypothetical protein